MSEKDANHSPDTNLVTCPKCGQKMPKSRLKAHRDRFHSTKPTGISIKSVVVNRPNTVIDEFGQVVNYETWLENEETGERVDQTGRPVVHGAQNPNIASSEHAFEKISHAPNVYSQHDRKIKKTWLIPKKALKAQKHFTKPAPQTPRVWVPCPECYHMVSEKNLTNHLRKKHLIIAHPGSNIDKQSGSQTLSVSCPVCSKSLLLSGYSSHMQEKHPYRVVELRGDKVSKK